MELTKAFDYAFSIILVGIGVLLVFTVQMTPSSMLPEHAYVGVSTLTFAGLLIVTGYLTLLITQRMKRIEDKLDTLNTLTFGDGK